MWQSIDYYGCILQKKVRHCCDSYQLLLLLSGSFRLKVLTLQVDEEGAMVQQSLWIQVSRHLCGQVDPSCHHQLSQLGGGGGGLLLERLEVKWMMAGVYIYIYIIYIKNFKYKVVHSVSQIKKCTSANMRHQKYKFFNFSAQQQLSR